MDILGIPVQSMIDSLMFVIGADHELEKVRHCGKDIIYFAVGDNSPCVPVDKTKYPNWTCVRDVKGNYYAAGHHHGCAIANKINDEVLWCECVVSREDDTTKNYFISTGGTVCQYCKNGHKEVKKAKTPPCPFCGEVH